MRNQGVFLSYARDDAAVARRIAGALGGYGIGVWFDQSERYAFAFRLRRERRGGVA